MGKLIIDGIEYSGGGDLSNNSVAFIDTSNVIVSKTTCTSSNAFTYKATQNCVLCMLMVASPAASDGAQDYYIDDKWVGRNDYAGSNGGAYHSAYFQLKKGQTFRLDKGASSYAVYGLISSSEQNSNRIIGKTFTKTIETMSTEPYGKLILVNEDISPYEIDGYEIKTIICTMKATTDISTHVFSLIATPYYEGNKLLITAFNGHGYNSTLCGILNFTVIYG